MKHFIFLLLCAVAVAPATAQKKPYYVLAYAQIDVNLVCGTKVMIKNEVVSLTAEEAAGYRNKYKAELEAKYNSKNRYKNLMVELFYPGTVVIWFEGERIYEQRRDGWDCTSTWLGFVKAKDNLSADNQLAKLQAENRKVTYSNFKRWGTPTMESDKTNDLDIRWVQTQTSVAAFITNSRKNAALQVSIKSFKKPSTNIPLEGNFGNGKKIEEHTIVLQPGESWQIKLDFADGYEVDTNPAELTQEKKGLINIIKPLFRRYLKNNQGKIIPVSNVGVRG